MKLKFKKQDFQDDAVDTVAGLFKGQEKANMPFSVADNSAQFNLLQNEFGFGNSLLIDRETLQNNLHAMQKAHSLPQTEFRLKWKQVPEKLLFTPRPFWK